MKKTFLPLLAFAAFAFSAHATPWFDAEIAGYESWPSDGSDKVVADQGTWTGTAGATLDAVNHVLNIDAPEGTTVAFAPTGSVDAATVQVAFESTNALSAVQPLANLAPLETGVKGALAAAADGSTTNFYGWAKDPGGATNKWLVLSGATPAVAVATEVRVLFKTEQGALKVQYQVNGTALAANGESWLAVATQSTELAHAGMRGGHLAVSALYAFTEETPPPSTETAVLALAALPANVSLVSVTTNGVAVAGVNDEYTVYSNVTATVTFAPAEGYRLVGGAAVDVRMDGNKTLATADMPTAELIPPPSTATLTLPALPDGVTLVSVTTNGVVVEAVESAYLVYDGAEVVATFAAAEGYVLSGSATATVTVDGDTELPAASIPTAVSIANTIKINEIMASNPSVDKGGITNALGIAEMDWIEIYNGTSEEVNLTGWYLSDNDKKGKEDKATILGSCVIPAKGYKIVWLDKIHVDPSEYGPDEAFAVLKLSSSGDLIQLADTNKAVVDKVDFKTKPQIKGYSYGPLSVVYNGNPVPGNGDPVYMKTATPGAPNVTEGWGDFTPTVYFSVPHGYKTEAFDLELICSNAPTAAIYYTLDGSSPTTASTPYTGAIHVDKTTVVRAAVPDPASVLQFDTSATYVFLDDVLAQAQSGTAPASAVGFPDDNAVNGQEMLYGMRQDVVTGSDRARLLRGFTNSIPTISVVTDPGNLFNASTGIYVNAQGDGVEWERQIMLEGFDPTGVGADFSQPAGIRIRGGWSRRNAKPKHSLRFFFRSSYGASSLAQKMFPGELPKEAGEYDKLDLRTSQNNSWANESSSEDTFVTEVFSRDSQRDLGQPYTRSRYYNLFINGQYWGLYQTQERGDEHWAESYLGGDSLQYDLIKTSTTYSGNNITYSVECNEGTWDAWTNLWRIATTEGFAGDYTNNYNKVLGLNPDGTRNPAYPILLNQESLMVYMLVSHYVVDRDGPTSPFSSVDKGHPNNFYAIRNRDDAGDVNGFVFLRHDAEVSMGHGTYTGASNNPTYWGTEECTEFTGAAKHRNLPYFTPAELHYLLMQNPVYKRAYGDLFYWECLREGGAMTVENATARYTSRMAEIDDAIVCEAARWGKGKTRSTWLTACKTSTTFITNRLYNMKSQYQAVGWYPSLEPPAIGDATGAAYEGDVVPYGELVYLTTAVADGTIYYTTNGVDDPMDAGVAYTGGFPIPDTGFTVRARVFKDDEWSALQEVALEADVPNDQRYGIRVAAILNAAVTDPDDEFLVLTNILDRAVDLNGLSIWSEKSGKALTKLAEFTNAVELAAGGTITLTQPANWISGQKLKNGGIFVELHDFNGKRIQNAFVDSEGWFQAVQGDKTTAACNKTGRWFIALEFLGDTEKGGVTEERQWTPSSATATLTLPALPAGVTLVSVTTNGVAVEAVEGVYTVANRAEVVVTFAAAEGYELVGSATAVVTVVGDLELPAASVPTAVSVNSLVKINEIMASNPSLDKGGITNALGIGEMDWVEFYNGSSQAIDLAGWFLSDNDKKGKETKATILGSCVIPAKGYKIVWLDKIHVDPAEYGPDEAFAVLKLSSSGDLIQLADPGTNVVDKIDFKTKKQIKGYSYGPLAVESDGVLVPGDGDPVYMKTATPGAPNVTEGWGDFTPAVAFSEPHGWKTAPFELTLSCADTNATIYYTLDGTSPTTASILYTNAIPITKTTIVRAAVPDPASVLQFDTSATYLYLDEVLAQGRTTTAPAGTVGFPDNSSKQAMLYGMLQLTGEDRERMLVGFTNAIPTISVVTDPGNLFNSSTGIYVNAKGEGVEWERQIMLEQFDPTGVGADFSQPAGIRIRGGNSRQPSWAKHAIRFFFRSSYGESSLAQKMFPGELPKEAGEYDKMDLRCSQNFSWANAKSTMDTFVTEVFARDSQRDMGQPYTRSHYCHLFLNGQYWGLYQTQERGDEHWGESYLGGDSLQYDVIKAASSWSTGKLAYTIECNEGTWDAWSNLWEIATTQGFGGEYTNNYNKVLGLNPDGTRNPNYPILLNAESLRVFMFSAHFMVDKDGPTSPYSGIDVGHANNFNAVRNRDDAGDVNGFVFLRHDAEVSMGMESKVTADKNPTFWGTDDPEAPAVGSPDLSGGLGKAKFRTIPYFTPAELHYLLMQNPVYAREYADAFYEFFLKEGGAMTVKNATARYASRMAEIDDAIVCEQARWAQNNQTRSTWLSACNTATNFIKNRLGYMKSQYQSAGWYPSIEPPSIGDTNGVAYEDDVVPYGELVYITTAVADGTIYYTTNGVDDPMDAGVAYTGGFPIPDTGFTVRARVFKDDEWSALQEVALEADVPNDQRYGIRVAAILNAAVNDPADEFIVLTNILDRAVDLNGLSIWSEKAGKALTKLAEFTNAVELAAGGTITLTQPANWISDQKLKNGGIFVELHDFNGKRIQNAYVDSEGWFQAVPGDKTTAACNKTGRWFVALAFLGDTDGGDVTLETQWMVNPLAPAIPLPEDATAKDEVLDAIADNSDIEDWLVEIGATEEGYHAITNFTGTKADIELCYLVDILPDSNPEVELTMPSITFDENGQPVVEGELLNHGTEIETTVRGAARLYYADTLTGLETATDYIQISPPTFPVTKTNDVSGAQIPNARFYRLKIIEP